MRNCTGDLDGLVSVLEDFFERRPAGDEFEDTFRAHLLNVAAHRYRRLESGLEWVLGLYKFVFPLLILQVRGPPRICTGAPAAARQRPR